VDNLDSVDLQEFRKALLGWFRTYRRDLPWRKNRDPYRIWISEIMLQQTRVAAVIPYYEEFLARFPDVKSLAEAPQEDVLRLWSGLGYYSRARNLQKAAQRMVTEFGGEFPRRREDILTLAGIGEYTAAAILSIAFDDKYAVLDGNVARVISRLEAIHGDLREPKRWRELQAAADRLLASESPGDWNQSVMELGATVCTPRAPQCLLCPVAQFCEARKLGVAESLPEKRKKRATVAVRLVSGVLFDARKNSLLLPPPSKTPGNMTDDHVPSLVAKLWHFPTISAPHSADSALRTLLNAQLPLRATKSLRPELLARVRHTVTYRTITVAAYLVRVKRLPKVSGAKTLLLRDFHTVPVSNLTRKIACAALNYLSSAKSGR